MDNHRRTASLERRLQSRYILTSTLHLPIRSAATGVEFSCRVIDYSNGGMLVERLPGAAAKLTLNPGDLVEIGIESDAGTRQWTWPIAASVVRISYAIVAFQFEQVDPPARKGLRTQVMQHVDIEAETDRSASLDSGQDR